MRRAAKADRIGAILDDLYPLPSSPLRHVDPYTLLVSVVLSAQTTDKKVNQVTPKLFARASTPAAMVRLSQSTIASVIKTIGLARTKAANIRAISKALLQKHDGEVPADFAALEALPGVGHKTASVVMAQGFGVPAFPVDTHIHRLARRWGLSSARNVQQTERDLKRLFPRQRWNARHLQIIYFGREHCPALFHDHDTCPICSWAASQRTKQRERRAWRLMIEERERKRQQRAAAQRGAAKRR